MRRVAGAILGAVLAFGGTGLKAEFSEEWEAYAAETRAACDAFEATPPPRAGASPVLVDGGDGYAWPRGAPGRSHVCLYYRFTVSPEGKPQDVELLHKEPENLHLRFVRAGKLAIEDRLYHPWDAAVGGDPSVVTKFVIVTRPNWRYSWRTADIR
jgi:hypothetical protein